MNRNMIETVLGAVVLIAAAVFLIFAYNSADLGKKEGYTIKADFDRIDGLKPGSDVRMNGVLVGSVTDVKLNKETFRATASFTVDPGIKLPRDTIAQVASESLLGGKYLSLEVGVDEETIPTDGKGRITQTTPPMRLDDLIGQLIYKKDDKKAPADAAHAAPAAYVPPGVLATPPQPAASGEALPPVTTDMPPSAASLGTTPANAAPVAP